MRLPSFNSIISNHNYAVTRLEYWHRIGWPFSWIYPILANMGTMGTTIFRVRSTAIMVTAESK